MKNFTKRILAILTSVLMASSMAVSASAASVTVSASCNGNSASSSKCYVSNFGCLSGTDLNALLGKLNSAGVSAALNSAPGCGTTTVAGAPSKCTSTANAAKSNSAAAKSTSGTANSSSNCTKATSAPTTAVKGTSTSGSCTASPTQSVKVSDNSSSANCGKVSGSSTTSSCGTLSASLNSFLKQFGTNLTNYSGTATAQTPQTSGGSTATATPNTDSSITGTASSGSVDSLSFEQQVVTLVNQQRAANGLAPLTLSTALSNVARTKSQDMHDNNYFSHQSPTYGSPFDMLKTFGISYSLAGENIAMGYATPEAVVTAWMNSPGHRANILNASYTQIGVGYVADGNYWTQEFIG